VLELKAIMFKSFYIWMVACNSSHFSNFLNILDLSYSFTYLSVSLVYFLYTWVVPLYASNKIKLLIERVGEGSLNYLGAKYGL
jgi:hypothetical protein